MFRILIVDDERIILNGCKLMITDMLSFDFPVEVFLADSVREALLVLDAHPIDLMLVDIRMPGHDGFELVQAVNESGQWPESVILTSHATFDYAQKGIRYGVRDFLLKPINEAQLRQVILDSYARRQKQQDTLRHAWRHDMAAMLCYDLSPSDLEMDPKTIQNLFPLPLFQVLTVQYTGTAPKSARFREAMHSLIPSSEALMLRDRSQAVCVFNLSEQKDFREALDERLHEVFAAPFQWMLSLYSDRFDQLHRLYVYNQQQLIAGHLPDSSALDLSTLCPYNDCLSIFFLPVREEIPGAVSRLLEQNRMLEAEDPQMISLFLESFRQNLVRYFRDLQMTVPGQLEAPSLPGPRSAAELKQAVLEMVLSARGEIRENEKDDKEALVLQHLLDYIRAHYTDDLSLDALAGTAGQHPNSVCRLFRTRTGHSYLYFLHQERVRAAKDLLLRSDDTMEMIAQAVGYNSTTQFTRIFRKYTQLTPAEYRRTQRR